MARVLKESHSFTCTPCVHLLTEWTMPAFAFPAEAGTHLPTPEGRKAELALGGRLVTYRNKCPAPGTEHGRPSHTNRARRRLTSLIEANVLTTMPDYQTSNACRDPFMEDTMRYSVVNCKNFWIISTLKTADLELKLSTCYLALTYYSYLILLCTYYYYVME